MNGLRDSPVDGETDDETLSDAIDTVAEIDDATLNEAIDIVADCVLDTLEDGVSVYVFELYGLTEADPDKVVKNNEIVG